MTQDEIIEMARQAKAIPMHKDFNQLALIGNENIETFAKLAVEKEREIWARRVVRLQNLMDLREQQPNKLCCIAERDAVAVRQTNKDDLIRARGQA